MKNLIFILSIAIFTLGSFQANAQDLMQGIPGESTNEIVDNQLKFLTQELVLSGKQQKLTQLKLTEFEMREKDIIQSDWVLSKKTEQITALNINKIREMRDILTGPQHDKYVQLIKNKRKANQAKMLED